MIMTSGTTGVPKLAMMPHLSFADMARKWLESTPISVGDNWISITPTAWIVDQMWGMGVALCGGMTMNFPETPETATEDFREIGPAVVITSSRFWEDLASTIRVKIGDSGWVKEDSLPPVRADRGGGGRPGAGEADLSLSTCAPFGGSPRGSSSGPFSTGWDAPRSGPR